MRVADCLGVSSLLLTMISPAMAADCAKFTSELDSLDRQASYLSISTVGDNSVYRAILAEEQISNLNAMRQMDLSLMMAAKCPVPATPISNSRYVLAATKCRTDELSQSGASMPDSCKQENWKPSLP